MGIRIGKQKDTYKRKMEYILKDLKRLSNKISVFFDEFNKKRQNVLRRFNINRINSYNKLLYRWNKYKLRSRFFKNNKLDKVINDSSDKDFENQKEIENYLQKIKLNNNENIESILPAKKDDIPTLIIGLENVLIRIQEVNKLEEFIEEKKDDELILTYEKKKYYVKIRPGTNVFLRKISKIYEIIIMSTLSKELTNMIIKTSNLDSNSIKYILSVENCEVYEGKYIKNIKKLGRDINNCIIMDIDPYMAAAQPMCFFQIPKWEESKYSQLDIHLNMIYLPLHLVGSLKYTIDQIPLLEKYVEVTGQTIMSPEVVDHRSRYMTDKKIKSIGLESIKATF